MEPSQREVDVPGSSASVGGEIKVGGRTETEIRPAPADPFAAMERTFQDDHDRRHPGTAYDDARPAYRFGYELAGLDALSGDWPAVEADARRLWEQRHPGTWERARAEVQFAYERARTPVSD